MGERLTREEVAKREIGHTDVSPRLRLVVIVVFLATILAPPVLQQAHDVWAYLHGASDQPCPLCARAIDVVAATVRTPRRPSLTATVFAVNREMLRAIHAFEDGFEDSSVVAGALRPDVQRLLAGELGVGNEKVYLGSDGWLYYRPAVDHLTGPPFLSDAQLERRRHEGSEVEAAPQPDPRRAIIDFSRQLESRGIHLVVLPVPVKASIEPGHLAQGVRAPVFNPSWQPLLQDLAAAGVTVFDPTEALLRAGGAEEAYLRTDTHWSPAGMDRVARALASMLEDRFGLTGGELALTREDHEASSAGDLASMLQLPSDGTLRPSQRVTTRPVSAEGDLLWRIDPSADVLLLGDSYANIYSMGALGWGEGAGLAETLSYYLERPLDAIVRNDDGAFATRLLLSHELARGRDRLAGKQVVVWEFTARELSFGDWRVLPMELGKPVPSDFFVAPPGSQVTVTGTIAAMGEVPRPRSAPYADHVVALRLVDLASEDPSAAGKEALVFMRSMVDYALTDVAHFRIGQRITVRLRPWSEVSDQYGMMNRGELYDPELMFVEPNWGVEVSR